MTAAQSAPVALAHQGIRLLLDQRADADPVTADVMVRLGTMGGPPDDTFDDEQRLAVYELLAIGYRHAAALQPARTVGDTAQWLTAVLAIARAHGPETGLHAGVTLSSPELAAATTAPETINPAAVRLLFGLGEPRDYDDLD